MFDVNSRIVRHATACLFTLAAASIAKAQVTHSFTEPYEQSRVASSEVGVIGKIHVVEGQRVQAGAVLAELEHGELVESLRMSEIRAKSGSKIKAARATLALNRRRLDSLEPLFKEGHANQEEYEEAKLAVQVASSDLELALEQQSEAAIDVARYRAMIKAHTIRSPIEGVVTVIDHHLAEFISGSNPKFATVAQLDKLRARFYLAEDDVLNLEVAKPVSVLLKVGRQMQRTGALIDFISPVTDPDSGTVRVDVMIENANYKIRSGSPCVWIHETSVPQVEDAPHVAIPAEAQ